MYFARLTVALSHLFRAKSSQTSPENLTLARQILRIRCYILLHLQVVEQFKIRIQLMISFQRLQIAHCRSRFSLPKVLGH